MAFRPRFNDSGTSRTDPLIYYTEGQSTTGNPYVTSASDEGNCTWYAWGRFWECGEPPTRPTNKLGYLNGMYINAEDWYGLSDGYERGSTPKLGAVICYRDGVYSGDGHVAVVEQINSDGTIIISESGYEAYRWRLRVADPNNEYPYSNSQDQYIFQGFIYNPYVNVINASPYVVASMCGNWWGESQVNPAIWESLIPKTWDYIYGTDGPNMGGYGLGQWTNVGSSTDRLWNLHTWVTNNGYQDGDGDGQLAYLPVENHWNNYPSPRLGYNTLTEFIESDSTSLSDLTYDFLICWEGIGSSDFNRRYGYAQQCYDYILQHQNDDPSQYQWINGNRYLSESETLNNVMVIWFWFSSGEPVPPLPIIKTSFIKYINKRKFMKRRGLTWR